MQDLNKPIVVDGVTYEPDEFYKRTLLVQQTMKNISILMC